MKSRKNLFYIGMFALCAIGFAACDDEETYDVYGDSFNRVYIYDNSKAYKIVQTPISTVSNVDFKWPAKCSQKASGTIKATVVVDNSLIAAYNEEHGTVFEAMPAEAIVLENAEMTIPAGKMVVADTVHVKLTDDANVLSTLKSEKGYIIPLRLVSAEGPNTQLSTNMVVPSFLTVTVTEDNVNHEATEADITGTLVADQAGWSVNVLSGSGSNLDRWFDEIRNLLLLFPIGRIIRQPLLWIWGNLTPLVLSWHTGGLLGENIIPSVPEQRLAPAMTVRTSRVLEK